MIGVNFFKSIINVDIQIHRGGHIIIADDSKPLFEGDQYSCMNKIRQLIDELSSLSGDRRLIFHIQNMTISGDLSVVHAKGFFKSNIERLNSPRCMIEVKAGLYNVFA